MIIFLAAVLDVPQHLYESAELDGAGPLQRLRWVTLPLVSPVILFSVVLGVIQGLQYFTQAYVAASVAAGQASQAGGTSTLELGYPEGSTLFYPILLYYHGLPLLRHGLRLGDGGAAARRRVRRDGRDHPRLPGLRALPGSGAMSTASGPGKAAPAVAADAAAIGAPAAAAPDVANHSLLIVAAIRVPRSRSSSSR